MEQSGVLGMDIDGSLTLPPHNTRLERTAEETGVRTTGHVALNDSTGLANVRIYLSLAAYTGDLIATTDENGDFQSDLKLIPGDENVTVWAELEGYSFVPSNYHWRHYHGLEERTLNFIPVEGNPLQGERPMAAGLPNKDIVIQNREDQINENKSE